MPHSARGPMVIGGLIVAALAVVAGVVGYAVHVHRPPSPFVIAPPPSPDAKAAPTVQGRKPSSTTNASAEKPRFESSYMDVVRTDYPALPTTQPLAVPLELGQAARFVLKDPVYLGKARGDLWITRPDAPPIKQVLEEAIDPNATDPQTHVLSEQVVYVHWMPTDAGTWQPYLVCRGKDGGFEVVSTDGRHSIGARRDYQWNRAFSWNDKIVVPSRTGIAVFQLRPEIKESYHDLLAGPGNAPTSAPADAAEPQALPDTQGLLAWIPWERGHTGSRGAARYLDRNWSELGPRQGWPGKIVHLVPLRDGTLFQFIAADNGSISVETTSPDQTPVDEHAIEKLVEQLNDPDPVVRKSAFSDLANFGPGAWSALAKLAPDQPPQAQLLLRQLLKDKNRPTLSGMTLLGGRSLQLVGRLSDGGVVFYAAQGVSIPEADGDPSTTAPAWLSVRPGHYIELLPPALVMDLKPEQCRLDVVGDQWIVNNDVRGPRLFYGNGFATLLRKDERQFSQIVGMDQRGRWLFRQPGDGGGTSAETLVIDPHLADPTPRLPVWQLAIADTVGWDKDNWPVVEHGGGFALTDSDWRPLDKNEKVFTRADEIPHVTPPATAPATGPTTSPATEPYTESPLLIAPDGTRYYDGLSELRVVQPDGKQIDWPLPPTANGTGPAHLVRTREGKLFLFNQPGRVFRIARLTGGVQPFQLEATFTHNIPSVAQPTRVWLDPADRIDIAWGNRLAILFPNGYVPRAISEKMVGPDDPDVDSR